MESLPASAWALTPGSAGHEVQCIGVVRALGLEPVVKRVAPSAPWSWMAPWGPAAPDPSIAPPWPDLVVASGRQAVPYARAIRRRARGNTFVLVLQNPAIALRHFDLVWVNDHDGVEGRNVIQSLTSPNTLTKAGLEAGAVSLAARLAGRPLPRPWIGVVLGGASGAYRFEPADAQAFGQALAALAAATGGSLIVTPSRRTGTAALTALGQALGTTPHWIWDGETGDNPYFGILGAADALVVTCDSVNMLGEAAFTGKPLYAWRLEGGSAKFDAFHHGLQATGAMRWFDGGLAHWTYPPVDANTFIADAVRTAYAAKRRRR